MAKRSRTALERAEQTSRLRARPARAQMLVAARELATARGYESIKAGDIAAAAGVSRETFYTHFADKRSCLAEAMEPRLGEIESELRIAAEEDQAWAAPILASLEGTLIEQYGSKTSPRGRIIQAMLGLVAERGYASVRLADVIKEAHVSYPSFYRHFKGKEQCFDVACESLVDGLIDQLQSGDDETEDSNTRLILLAELLRDDANVARILAVEARRLSGDHGMSPNAMASLAAELFATTAWEVAGTREAAEGQVHLGLNGAGALRFGAFLELLRSAVIGDSLDRFPTRIEELSPHIFRPPDRASSSRRYARAAPTVRRRPGVSESSRSATRRATRL